MIFEKPEDRIKREAERDFGRDKPKGLVGEKTALWACKDAREDTLSRFENAYEKEIIAWINEHLKSANFSSMNGAEQAQFLLDTLKEWMMKHMKITGIDSQRFLT
jgi:hypothetical protein